VVNKCEDKKQKGSRGIRDRPEPLSSRRLSSHSRSIWMEDHEVDLQYSLRVIMQLPIDAQQVSSRVDGRSCRKARDELIITSFTCF
nr:hypothetical protein [Tanacetum cinerariifolium]